MSRADALDLELYEEVTDILEAAEQHESRLTPWEVDFVADLQERVSLWGQRVRITDAQIEVLRRIERRIG